MDTQQKAQDVAQLLLDDGVDHKVAFDPATILLIIQIISQVISMIAACKKTPKQALMVYQKPGIMQQAKLRKMVREHLKLGILDPHSDDVVRALVTVGKGVTLDDVSTKMEEDSE